MAFNIIPKSLDELLKVGKDSSELTELYNFIVKNYNIHDPFSFEATSPKKVKVIRALQDSLDLRKFKTSYNIDWGNGSRGSGGSNNKGLLYERELFADLQEYIAQGISNIKKNKAAIEDIIKLIPKGYHIDSAIMEGEKNQKRPLNISSTSITTGKKMNGSWDIGATVTDITIICKNANGSSINLYLSLKIGNTVTFVNSGVTKYLNKNEISTGLVKNASGKELLDLFGIDNKKFCAIFNSYTGKGNTKELVTVTNTLKSSKLFKEFMRSIIGYGYILVHKIGSKTHIINMTKAVMDNMIEVKKATIIYPTNGSAKRIDVLIEMNGIVIKINIRNKQGGLYPTHIMADYVMEH